MNISTTDARPLFTKKLIAIFSDRIKPKAFLRSFFTEVETDTKELSIEVERGTEKVAVDVIRSTAGNRNTWPKSTEHIIVPPFYWEYFDATELDAYDALYSQPEISAINFGRFLDKVQGKIEGLMDKIYRAYELQCSQVLQTGVVQLNAGINIDFGRKAASLVNLTGAYWTDNNVDPNTALELGCQFLREQGKSEGAIINAIMGSTAFTTYLNNAKVQTRAGLFNYSLDNITMTQKNALGQSYHGEISVGSYRVRLWTYPEIYETKAGAFVPYIEAKTVVLVPEMPKFVLGYAAVPQLVPGIGIMPKAGKFLVRDFIDELNTAHRWDVKSAGVAIPVAIDQIYTMKVVA